MSAKPPDLAAPHGPVQVPLALAPLDVARGLTVEARPCSSEHHHRVTCADGAFGQHEVCGHCFTYERALDTWRAAARRHSADSGDPGLPFAVTQWPTPGRATVKIHARACGAIQRAAGYAFADLETLGPEDAVHGRADDGAIEPRWPVLLSAEQAMPLNLRRCRTCAPGLAERQQPARRRRSGLGWPA